MKIVWFPRARSDLEELRAFIAVEAPAAAQVVADRIADAVETLVEFPQRGRPGRFRGTRELVVARTPFVVAYRLREDTVEILHIVHGARHWPVL